MGKYRQEHWALATFQRSLPAWCQSQAKDQSLACLLVSMLRALRMVPMSALISLHFGQERKIDSGVAVDTPSTLLLCPEPFQHHRKNLLATAPDLSHLASSTVSPKHRCSHAPLTMLCFIISLVGSAGDRSPSASLGCQ